MSIVQRCVVIASVILAMAPAVAGAAVTVGPGAIPQGSGNSGCSPPPASGSCTYVQQYWMRDGTAQLPWASGPAVVTRFRMTMNKGGHVSIRIYRRVSPDQSDETYGVVASNPLVSVADGSILDAGVRLPIVQDEVLGVALYDGAQPWLNWNGANPSNGQGALGYADGDAASVLVKPEPSKNTWLTFDATVEGDADADGFGDETQDHCPGVAGPTAGCPDAPAQPAPPGAPPDSAAGEPDSGGPGHAVHTVLGDVRLAGRRLDYRLTHDERVRVLLERRSGGRWRTTKRLTVSGRAGPHRLMLASPLRRGRRLVVEVRSRTGRVVARRVVSPG